LVKQTREDRGLFKDDAKSFNQSLRTLVQSEQWQQAEVENLLAEQQTFMAKKALQNATNKHQVWNLLTVEQQTQLAEKITEKKAHKKYKKAKKVNQRKADKRFKRLDLTEQQVAAIASIKATAKADIQLTQTKIKSFKQAERQLIQSADFTAAAWQGLWDQYQGDFATAKVLKTKMQHETWNVLTPEQQAKSEAKGKKARHSN
jgi:Spy/CpxP family protein refolding chaperone